MEDRHRSGTLIPTDTPGEFIWDTGRYQYVVQLIGIETLTPELETRLRDELQAGFQTNRFRVPTAPNAGRMVLGFDGNEVTFLTLRGRLER